MITVEQIRAVGGIVHSDGNIFFKDISMLHALEAPAAPTLVGDEQADSYLAEPGRLATLARSHPAGLVRALARAALAAAPQAPEQ